MIHFPHLALKWRSTGRKRGFSKPPLSHFSGSDLLFLSGETNDVRSPLLLYLYITRLITYYYNHVA